MLEYQCAGPAMRDCALDRAGDRLERTTGCLGCLLTRRAPAGHRHENADLSIQHHDFERSVLNAAVMLDEPLAVVVISKETHSQAACLRVVAAVAPVHEVEGLRRENRLPGTTPCLNVSDQPLRHIA